MEYLNLILRTLSTFKIKTIHTHIYAYRYVGVALCLYMCLAVSGKTGFIVFIITFDSKGSHRE